MAVVQNMNQFSQTPLKGNVAAITNADTISVQVDANSSNTIYPGDFVRLTDTTGSTIVVDLATTGQTADGVVIYTPKKASFTAGDPLEIALPGSVVYLESYGAISRGHRLEWYSTGNQVKSWAGANPTCAKALDKASATGQLIRALILESVDTDYSSSSSCRSSSSSCRSSSSSSSSSLSA